MELTGALGALSLQGALSRARDNLADVASILWPDLSANWQQVQQFGTGVPENGGFDASHVPDQSSTNRLANLVWSRGNWSLTYAWNRSDQDNRQPGREEADFRATVHAVALGLPPMSRLSSNIDLSDERQEQLETGTTQRLGRLGGSAQLQLARHTALSGAFSQSRSRDPFAGRARDIYYLLLRIEATSDKEGDSSLGAVGAGAGVVPGGAVAGFPMPTLRYVVGSGQTVEVPPNGSRAALVPLTPAPGAVLVTVAHRASVTGV